MSERKKEKRSKDGVEKKHKKDRSEKKQKANKVKKTGEGLPFSLLADEAATDPTLASLFVAKPTTPKQTPTVADEAPESEDSLDGSSEPIEPSEEVDAGATTLDQADVTETPLTKDDGERKRKRKRKQDGEEIEDAYMRRLVREEAREAELAAAERATRRQKAIAVSDEADQINGSSADPAEAATEEGDSEPDAPLDNDIDEDDASPPPRHETQQAEDEELAKANRTVFLGNVSTAAISSKAARTELIQHLKSFFKDVPNPGKVETYKLESIRFRSTPYESKIPKKAAFATKQLMDATSKSTNAYAVYSSPIIAREATRRLNGSVVLGRHLRVDEVAHPAKVDHRRCIFVGNLGFVDDESNIQAANEEEGKEKRKPGKQPADVEEGLWRTFGKCGTVESVRVIRDPTTRVGKGIAYVQFEDENAVEAALLYNEKKFPPMLPRKLRVSRAKAQKRNTKPSNNGPSSAPNSRTTGYQRKVTGPEASRVGRAGKLYGRAAAAGLKQSRPDRHAERPMPNGIKRPESFVFEGHRASSKGGKAGLKLGGKNKKKPGKPTNRSAKRGAAFKAAKKVK